jgi:polo-like kinase 4
MVNCVGFTFKISPATDRTLYAFPSIHQALHHPSVVSCFFAYSTPSVSYHVLEYCANGDLWHFLLSRKSPVLSEESEVRGVLKNLVDALVYLEKELIVHRDVLPNNVLVTEDYRVVRNRSSRLVLLLY